MSGDKIIGDWKKKIFKPVYWLEGEEEYYIDKIISYAENNILSESEASFNLTVFYGKDTSWTDVVNACMRYPMFSERQVVILKEGQQMKDIERLEPYIIKPLSSTIFVVGYKDKKVDGRSKFAKVLKEKGELFTTKKMYDSHLPEWTTEMVRSKGFSINHKASLLLVDHLGNDLSRIENEIDKMIINLGQRKIISEDDIEKFVGISKEYNAFELNNALARKDLAKVMRIVQYFEANPKAGPIQMVLPTLYGFFSKVFMIFGQKSNDEKSIAAAIGVNNFFVRDYIEAARNYGFEGTERALLLLHHYNLRSVGIDDAGVPGGSLMKEMVGKMVLC